MIFLRILLLLQSAMHFFDHEGARRKICQTLVELYLSKEVDI